MVISDGGESEPMEPLRWHDWLILFLTVVAILGLAAFSTEVFILWTVGPLLGDKLPLWQAILKASQDFCEPFTRLW